MSTPVEDTSTFSAAILKVFVSRRFDGWRGYALAGATVAAALLLRLVLQGVLADRAVFTLFIPAIVLTSILAGFGPGAVAVVLSVAIGTFLSSLVSVRPTDPISLVVLAAVGLVI